MNMYRSLAPYYEALFPLNTVAASFVRTHEPENCRRLLDVGCGTGAMVRHLSTRYALAVGLDPDPEVIREAIRLSDANGQRVRFHVAGMSEMAAVAENTSWDMILCLGNTLPHLTRGDQQRDFLRDARKLLRDAGRIVIQTVNFDNISIRDPYQFPVLKRGEVDFHRMYRPTAVPEVIKFETRLELPEGPPVEGHTLLSVLKRDKLESLMDETGFHTIGFFGDFGASSWSGNSPATIVVAEAH